MNSPHSTEPASVPFPDPQKAASPCLLAPPPPGVHPSPKPTEPSPSRVAPARAVLPRCADTATSAGGSPRSRPLSWESPHAGPPGLEQGSGDPHPRREPRADASPLVSPPQHGPCPETLCPRAQNGGSQARWRSRSLGQAGVWGKAGVRGEAGLRSPRLGVGRHFRATLGIPLSPPRSQLPPQPGHQASRPSGTPPRDGLWDRAGVQTCRSAPLAGRQAHSQDGASQQHRAPPALDPLTCGGDP